MFGIVANVLSDHVLRTGAKVWVCGVNGDVEHPEVIGVSKSGRPVRKFTHFKRLTNFRAAWIPEHMRAKINLTFEVRGEAEAHASRLSDFWSQVRYRRPDGAFAGGHLSLNEAFLAVSGGKEHGSVGSDLDQWGERAG